MIRKIITWGSVATAVIAIVTAWTMLGLPTPAWTSDIKRLDRQQVDNAVRIYQQDVRSLLSLPPPKDPVGRQNWEEQLRQSRQKLDLYQRRQIEMKK